MSEHSQFPAPTTIPRALGRLRVALDDAYLRASRDMGLSAQQAELLCAALRPASVGDLAKLLRCDQSNVTRLVDRASKRGLIRRRDDEHDGRLTVIELSPTGRRLAERFIESLEAQLSGLLTKWNAEEQQTTVVTLNTIADALDGARPAARARSTRAARPLRGGAR